MPLKTAVVGMGPQGRRILKVLPAIPDLRLVAVADQRREVLDGLALPPECAAFTSADELFGKVPGVEVALIATTAPSHAALALSAIERGARFVMMEKPMACSVEECLRVEEAARSKGTRLCVNHGLRHDPAHAWLKERIGSGDWGAIRSVYVQRPGIGLGCVGSHSIDQINHLVGREVRSVAAWIDEPKRKNPRGEQFRDPGGLVVLDYGDEIKGIVLQNEDGAGPISMEINLQRARVKVDEKLNEIQILERDASVTQGPNKPASYRAVQPPESLVVKMDLFRILESVLRELVSGGPMICGAGIGRQVLEVLAAAYASHEAGHVPVRPAELTAPQRSRTLAIT